MRKKNLSDYPPALVRLINKHFPAYNWHQDTRLEFAEAIHRYTTKQARHQAAELIKHIHEENNKP